MNQPLVTVLITCYNREKYIAEAIESILNSSFTDFELIVVDDASTDKSYDIATSFCDKDTRIKVYRNEVNLGDYPNRSKAASYAKGKYIKYLDSDDLLYKYSLEYMVDCMERFPGAALGLSFNTINDSKPYPQFLSPKEVIYEEFLGKSVLGVGPSAAIIKRSVFEDIGGFVNQRHLGDHDLWIRIASKYSVVKLQPALIWWRIHPEQEQRIEWRNIMFQDIRFKLSLKHLENSKSFFSEKDFSKAKKKICQNYVRKLYSMALKKKKIKQAYKLFNLSGLSIKWLYFGLKPYY